VQFVAFQVAGTTGGPQSTAEAGALGWDDPGPELCGTSNCARTFPLKSGTPHARAYHCLCPQSATGCIIGVDHTGPTPHPHWQTPNPLPATANRWHCLSRSVQEAVTPVHTYNCGP
jgi:hypothetical protein